MVSRAALCEARKEAEKLMRSVVRVERFQDMVTFDPSTLAPSRSCEVIYEGRGKVQSYEGYARETTSAGASVTITRTRVDLPVGVFRIRPGDIVTIVANPDDPQLEGTKLRISAIAPFKSFSSSYRVFADEETRG